MSNEVKIGLAVAGVAIVGYFLLKSTTAPTPTKTTFAPLQSITAFASGIVADVTALSKLGSTNAPNPNATSPSGTLLSIGNGVATYGGGVTAPIVPNTFDTSNYSTSQGFEYTDSSGNFIAG